jgi:hypothetical protein
VVAGGLVRALIRPPDELLEHETHLDVADDTGVEVGLREFLGHREQLVLLRQLVQRLVELEPLEERCCSR